jgi:hypothetical protein
VLVTGFAAGGAVRGFVGSGAGTSLETVAMAIVAGPRTYANISLTHSLAHSLARKEGSSNSPVPNFAISRKENCLQLFVKYGTL